jgi:hypothetical protein
MSLIPSKHKKSSERVEGGERTRIQNRLTHLTNAMLKVEDRLNSINT